MTTHFNSVSRDIKRQQQFQEHVSRACFKSDLGCTSRQWLFAGLPDLAEFFLLFCPLPPPVGSFSFVRLIALLPTVLCMVSWLLAMMSIAINSLLSSKLLVAVLTGASIFLV